MLGENNYSSYQIDGVSKSSCKINRIPGFEIPCLDVSPFRSFEQEITQAYELSDQLKYCIDDLYSKLRSGSNVKLEPIRNLLLSCVSSIERNVFTWLFLCQVKNPHNYLVEHAFRTAVLAMTLGARLRLSSGELAELGLAAMVSDVGKIMIPNSILEKEGALNSAEYAVIQVHPLEGRKILLSQTDASAELIEVVISHHEQIDGTGYPTKLFGECIPYFARIVAIADAYDAMTSERSYAPARSITDAQAILWFCRDRQFDASMVETFLSMVGAFPPGSEIRLPEGGSAVVLEPLAGKKAEIKVVSTQDPGGLHVDVVTTDARQSDKRYIASHEPGVPNNMTQQELRDLLLRQNTAVVADIPSNN